VGRPAARQMSFADLELLRQGVRLEPLLRAICDFLDKQPALVERVRRDLVRGLKQPDHGRRGLTAAQVLRALVLMRVKDWDYRELRERIADGITLRAFTNFYCETSDANSCASSTISIPPARISAATHCFHQLLRRAPVRNGALVFVDGWQRPSHIATLDDAARGFDHANTRDTHERRFLKPERGRSYATVSPWPHAGPRAIWKATAGINT